MPSIDLHPSVSIVPDPHGVGSFLALSTAAKASARQVFPLGTFSAQVVRWTCTHRNIPYWMVAAWGARADAVPRETQWLLAELADGRVAVVVPLLDGAFRCSLEGYGGELQIVAESGDASLVTSAVTGAFIAEGADPHELMPRAAEAVAARLGGGRLRRDKPLPAFADRFGWCTWDAFYQDVTAEKVREGLESFKAIGVQPRVVILDDGWQSERTCADGSRRLTSLAPNAKFGGDLSPTVRLAKDGYGVETFLVWHAFMGYWGGIDGEALPGYGVRTVERQTSPGLKHYVPTHDEWWGPAVGVPDAALAHRFYHDYHRSLRRMGVDGVKVDVQAATETVAAGQGGRVTLMHRLHEALEGSVQVHFQGNLINCMSCANEMFYGAPASSITRTSDDFYPTKPETHARHLVTNSWVGLWFGEFCHPDWDMFQSGHETGAYHAAGRAVSGAPIYVSDKPGKHGPELLRKLVLSDGSTARCQVPGRPTRDCLFADPLGRDALLTIVNRTAINAVVGAFNARYHAEETQRVVVRGSVRSQDVPGLGTKAVSWTHYGRQLGHGDVEVALPEMTAEVVTFAPIDDGIAPIGLTALFAPGGGVASAGWYGGDYVVRLRDGGEFLAWSGFAPSTATFDGKPIAFRRDADGGVRVTAPAAGELRIRR